MKNFWNFNIILILATIGYHQACAFTCYKCNSKENELCVDEASELPTTSTTQCDGFCTIVRTEYTDIPGEVVILTRDCEKKPIVPNGVRTDKHLTKMYTSCNTDRCNSGNGKREPGDRENGNIGPKDIIIVYESSSGVVIYPQIVFIISAFLYLLL